jgi:hypothetical protein
MMKHYNVRSQCANRDAFVLVASLQEDSFALLTPLSSAKITEPANGEPPHLHFLRWFYVCVELTLAPQCSRKDL